MTSDNRDQEFAERLVRIETKLDHIADGQTKNSDKYDKMDKRITDVEAKFHKIGGVLLAINVVVLFFADKIRGVFN